MAFHGTPSRYNNEGCRCEPCRVAWSDYRRQRHGRPTRPIGSPAERAHAVGMAAARGVRTAAAATGRSKQTIRNWCLEAGVTPYRPPMAPKDDEVTA